MGDNTIRTSSLTNPLLIKVQASLVSHCSWLYSRTSLPGVHNSVASRLLLDISQLMSMAEDCKKQYCTNLKPTSLRASTRRIHLLLFLSNAIQTSKRQMAKLKFLTKSVRGSKSLKVQLDSTLKLNVNKLPIFFINQEIRDTRAQQY